MPDNTTFFPNLYELSRIYGKPEVSRVIEVLNKSNPMLDDIPWVEANMGTTHLTTIRTGIPLPMWRMLNSGTGNGKSSTAQIKAFCGMLETWSEIDKKLVDLAPNAADFLASENAAFIEGFSQKVAESIFYGKANDPKEIPGLINYYNKLATATRETNVLNGGSTSADGNTSIWLVCWGDRTIHGLYPKGSTAGLKEEYLGEDVVHDEDGGKFIAARTHYSWDLGLVVRDWRFGGRIANINVDSVLNATGAQSEANVIDLLTMLTRLVYKIPNGASTVNTGSYRSAIYLRKELLTLLDLQCQKRTNIHLTYTDIQGKPVLTFRGIPLREQETLSLNEKKVS